MNALRERLIKWLVPEREAELEQAALTKRLLAEARMENSTLTRKVWAMEEQHTTALLELATKAATADQVLRDKLNSAEKQAAEAAQWAREKLGEMAERNLDLRRQLGEAQKQARMPFEARETDSAPPWLPEDAQWWRDVLAGPRGQRIKQALNFWSNYKDRAAVTRLDRHEYACGEAAGFYLCAEFLLNKLSADIQPQSDEDGKAGQGASSLHERIAP